MAGKIFRRNKGNEPASSIEALGSDNSEASGNPIEDIVPADEDKDGLTGPEAAVAQAHHDVDFSDLDEGDLEAASRGYVAQDPETKVPDSVVATPPSNPPATSLSPYARQLVLKGFESLQRIPSASLSENYRSQLLFFRDIVNNMHKAGVRGLARMMSTSVGLLATDARGKIDALMLLRHLMRQAVWQASVDINRIRTLAKRRGQRPFGEDEVRDAPLGMDGMSDHSDAIAGVRGSQELIEYTEDDIIDGLTETNGFLSAYADALCDTENDRIYYGLESGLQYIDVPGLVPGSWVGVFSASEAIDIQLVKNQESQVRRDAERTLRRREALLALENLAR